MNIFVKIKNAIYNPSYYSEVIAKPFSYSFKYLLVFALLFALVFTIVAIVKFVPVVNMLSNKAPQLADFFPQDLTVTIKDGKASTNVQEPYFIKIPLEYKNRGDAGPNTLDLDNYVVIDTKSKFNLDNFYSYKTFVLLNSDSITYIENGKISISSLSGVADFTLNRNKIISLINILKPFLAILYPIVFVGVFIGGFFVVLLKMIYLLFGALLIWLVAKIKGMKIGYGGSYRAGMQLITAPIIITSVLWVILPGFTFTFFFSILLIISAALNLKKGAEQAPVSVPAA